MGIEKTYTDELFAQNRYYASWVSDEQIKLGDIGDIEGHSLHRIDNIDDFTVPEARKQFASPRLGANRSLHTATFVNSLGVPASVRVTIRTKPASSANRTTGARLQQRAARPQIAT